jgi:AraC-like DNA-binding protein
MVQSAMHLRKYPAPGSTGGDALRSLLATHFPGHQLELGPRSNDSRVRIGFCPLNNIQLYYGSYERELRLRIPDSRYFIHGFPIRGAGEAINNNIAMTTSPGRGALAEPGEISFSTGPDFEHVVMLIAPEALLKTVAALVGTPTVSRLRLDFSNIETRRESRLLRSLVKLLVEELDAEDSIPPPPVIAELEQAILMAFLCGNRHNYSNVLAGGTPGAAPWQIRRVEEYIEANWDQPITIEALAVVANASTRSVFHSFQEHRRYSPMSFVKHVRLTHAREMLRTRADEMTVTSVAFACGFGNLGHFANDYKRAFGEMPSATLLRAKSGLQCGP